MLFDNAKRMLSEAFSLYKILTLALLVIRFFRLSCVIFKPLSSFIVIVPFEPDLTVILSAVSFELFNSISIIYETLLLEVKIPKV